MSTAITVTPSRRGFRLRCECGCLDVPDVPEGEVGMLVRIHFDASHAGNGSDEPLIAAADECQECGVHVSDNSGWCSEHRTENGSRSDT